MRKVGDHAVEIETTAPFPILPDTLTTLGMMSKKWCEENKAERPVDRRKGIENTAQLQGQRHRPVPPARSASPTCAPCCVRNFNYWGKIEGNVDEVVFTPIGNDATRVAALLSGEIDVMEPVPLQDIERIKAAPATQRAAGPRAAHHLPRHGPEARRAAVLAASRARTRSRTSACARRSTRRSTIEAIKTTRDARRRDADRR